MMTPALPLFTFALFAPAKQGWGKKSLWKRGLSG